MSLLIPGDDDVKVSIESAKLERMKDFCVIPSSHPFIMNNKRTIAQALTFLGAGPSGKPSQIGPIHVLDVETGETKPKEMDSEETRKSTEFKWRVTPGALFFLERIVTHVVGQKKKVNKQPVSTKHSLVMP